MCHLSTRLCRWHLSNIITHGFIFSHVRARSHTEATLDTRYLKPRFRQRVQTCAFIFHSVPTMSLCDHHIPSGRGLLCSCALSHAFAPVHKARLREVSLFMPADVVDSFVQMLCEDQDRCSERTALHLCATPATM